MKCPICGGRGKDRIVKSADCLTCEGKGDIKIVIIPRHLSLEERDAFAEKYYASISRKTV